MTLAAIDALSMSGDEPDYDRIMQNFTDWYRTGAFTATGEVFDVGMTCREAIFRYGRGTAALDCGLTDENACGNGGLMRVMPALFWCLAKNGPGVVEQRKSREMIHALTALTHAHSRCLAASGLYLAAAEELLNGKEKHEALRLGFARAKKVYEDIPELAAELPFFERVLDPEFEKTPKEEIRSRGYVIDTIEAAVWSFLGTDSYKDCIVRAINLGHDADTVAEVAGGFAGLYYGLEGIPQDWRETVLAADMITALCDSFADSLEQ